MPKIEQERYKRVTDGLLGKGAFGEVTLATIDAPPNPHPCTYGYLASTSFGLRGITSTSSNPINRKRIHPDNVKLEPNTQPPSTSVSLALTSEDEDLLRHYNDLDDTELTSTWDQYPTITNFPPKQTQVAIKRMSLKDSRYGFTREALRELKLLREVKHDNIVSVLDVYIKGQNLYMVMEVLPHDLKKLICDTSVVLRPGDIKRYMHMMLSAIAFIHSLNIVHRDIKPDNMLVAANGVLKLSDFGGARQVSSPSRRMSPEACTIWYRAPELLFDSTCYGTASDMWSIGCVFGELLKRNALFQSLTTIELLCKIACIIGNPDESTWPGLSSLPSYFEFTVGSPPLHMTELFPAVDAATRDLISKMLQWNPASRITAAEALQHPYFSQGVPMTDLDKLPKITRN